MARRGRARSDTMTRGRYYAAVMPIAGILYVIALVVLQDRVANVAVVGALILAILAVIGATVIPAGR
jgi:hypothetical protein